MQALPPLNLQPVLPRVPCRQTYERALIRVSKPCLVYCIGVILSFTVLFDIDKVFAVRARADRFSGACRKLGIPPYRHHGRKFGGRRAVYAPSPKWGTPACNGCRGVPPCTTRTAGNPDLVIWRALSTDPGPSGRECPIHDEAFCLVGIGAYIKLYASERSLSGPHDILCKGTGRAGQIGRCCRMLTDQHGT